MKRKVTAQVISQKEIAPGIYDMWIASDLAKQAKPGQFLCLYPQAQSTLLPRPISICEVSEDQKALRIVYRVAGQGTREFSGYLPGQGISVMGTLGNGFPVEEGMGKRVFLMGGGIGIPPILQLAKTLRGVKDTQAGIQQTGKTQTEEMQAEDKQTGKARTEEVLAEDKQTGKARTEEVLAEDRQFGKARTEEVLAEDKQFGKAQTGEMLAEGKQTGKSQASEIQIIAGYRDNQLFLAEDLEKYGHLYLATEDGSAGTKGNVLDAVAANALQADVIFACGPMPMLRAIKDYAEKEGIPAYISLEEHMACGVGACLGCVVKTKNVDAHSHVHNARICTDGPVFEAREVQI